MANREVIADLVAQVSLDGAKFQQGMGKVNRELKTVQEELKTARSRFRRTGDSTDFLGRKSTALSSKIKLQKSQVDLLSRSYRESRENSGKFSKNTQDLARRLERANRELSETESELKDVNRELRNQPNKWQEIGRDAQSAGDKMMTAGRNMRRFGQAYTMGVTMPIVAGAAAVFKASMDFETAFTGVEKTVDGSKEQMDELKQSIRDMALEIPSSTDEIAGVAEAAGQLGIQTENIKSFTRVMVDLGESTNLSAKEAATQMARFANVVGMSQGDFDKLGATVVDLGNNMATTEAEISEMALRLAGAGNQIGLSESQILAFSSALSSVGIKAEAGGSAFSRVMVDMANSVANTDDKLSTFAEVAGTSADDFAKSFEEDAAGALMDFVSGLGEMSSEGENTFGVLEELGFSQIRVRDALLRASEASGVFSDALDIGSDAWKENTALTEEAEKRYETTESQLKMLWNRIKDVGITLGNALVPAVMDAIEAAEPFIQNIEDGAEAFSEMSEKQQQSILKMVGFAAAIGPASIVLGGLTTTIGGVAKAFGGLAGLLGRAGGTGLLARIAGLGVSGPVGLAIAGVGALGGVVYALTRDSEDLNDVNWDVVEGMQKEVEETDNLIGRFEELERKNKLSSDEMLRYMDILDELSQTNSKQEIEKLKNEQERLLEKSGLTNEEMQEFLDLNDKVIEKAPTTKKAISEEGNAYAENLSALKELNEEKRKEMLITAERELEKALENESSLMKEQKELVSDIKRLDQEIMENKDKRIEKDAEIKEAQQGLKDIQGELLELEGQSGSEAAAKRAQLKEQEKNQKLLVEGLKSEKEQLEVVQDKLIAKFQKKNDDLELTRDEIAEMDKLKWDYEELILAQAGINSEKGKGLEKIDTTISKLEEEKQKLKDQTPVSQRNTGEYQDQVDEINNQIGKLEGARSKLEEVNDLAGQTVYDKEVNLSVDPTAAAIDRALGQTVYKKIKADVQGNTFAQYGLSYSPYAEGTDYHPGGLALTGEEGPELARSGSRWSMLDFGLHDLPRGTQVFTHDESKRIMSALNNMPGYARGVSPSGEADRVVGSLNGQVRQDSQPIVLEMHITNEMDGRAVGKTVEKHVTDLQQRKSLRKRRAPHAKLHDV
ncbi:phage tail tape measure protein [Lentibacillus salicampi]|uniref:Phage tail tape measure protein n=1 Tax=Lentibacillus salicampi TaxID=175306 RepID=A0A4Y9A9I8_9BACI|nr:phage tail tape measure protein [Lentibacillus salicampi]TFJ92135.1 phage tail tape measure protein [Lentibacillus salicampi]